MTVGPKSLQNSFHFDAFGRTAIVTMENGRSWVLKKCSVNFVSETREHDCVCSTQMLRVLASRRTHKTVSVKRLKRVFFPQEGRHSDLLPLKKPCKQRQKYACVYLHRKCRDTIQ